MAVTGAARLGAGAVRVGGRAAVAAGRATGRAAASGARRVGSRATKRPGSSRPTGKPRHDTTRPSRKKLGLNPVKQHGPGGRRGKADRHRLPGRRTLRRLRPRSDKDQQQRDDEEQSQRRPGRVVGRIGGPPRPDGAGPADPAAQAERTLRTVSRAPGRILRLGRGRGRHRMRRRILVILTAMLVLFFGLPIVGVVSDGWASSGSPEGGGLNGLPINSETLIEVSRRTGIPTCEPDRRPGCVPALEAYLSAAGRAWRVPNGEGTHNVDWAILAAIGKKECDHGRGNCKKPDKNHCGARGPMQFLGNTWRAGTDPVRSGECPGASHFTGDPVGPPIPEGQGGGSATDGDNDGTADPWSFYDAAHAAARYLVRNGVKGDQRRAILAYNNSQDYASDVLRIAGDYRQAVEDLVVEPGSNVAGGPCPVQPQGGTTPMNEARSTQATNAMANAVIGCFGRNSGIGCYDPRPPEALFEHPRGRACDFMITSSRGMPSNAEQQRGQAMAEWVMANARSLNVLYIIWYDRSWNPSDGNRPWSQWRDYSGCKGDPSSCHYNHVHVSVKLMPGDPGWAHCPHSDCSE